MAGKRTALYIIFLFELLTVSSAALSAEPVRFGVNSSLSISDTFECYRPLLEYLTRKLGNRVEMVLREKPWEIDDLLRQGNVSIAIVSPLSYVQNRSNSELELLVVPEINGTFYYYAYVILHKNSSIRDLNGLQGKRFAAGKTKSVDAALAPMSNIVEVIRATPEKYFGTVQHVGSFNEALSLLASGQVDGAYIDSIAYDYAMRKKMAYVSETKILSKTGPLVVPPIVARKKMDPVMKAKLREVLLNMHSSPDGKTILADLGFDKFIVPKPSLYNGVK